MKTIHIIGSGGHTRSSINLLKQYFKETSFCIYDDSYDYDIEEYIDDVKIVGKVSKLNNENIEKKIFLSIGDNKTRENYFNYFHNKVLKKSLIHTTVYKENNITIGVSNQIFANVYMNSQVLIGDNNIINTGVILEHEVKIGSHNHISVGAKICGRVTISNRCFIGAGAVIIDKISICDDVIVGAGSVVINNITEPGTYVGNPARKIS
jgi:sugar O-acyltransferase (sialic acid O-acetyltransferase NeuD family)